MAHGLVDDDGGGSAPAAGGASACGLARRLSFLLVLMGLAIVEYVSIAPCVQYIILTFFAAGRGGGDCEVDPSSAPCRQAASDAAVYGGVSSGVCSGVGAVFALGLGSRSDRLGRRPIVRARCCLSLVPIAALALHVFAGSTLWLYLVASPVLRSFDISGVLLAFISDVVVEPQQRAQAIGVFTMVCISAVVVVLPFAGLLPAWVDVLISLAAAVLKIAFVFLAFPETVRHMGAGGGGVRPQGLLCTPAAALRLLTRHSFILRMALVLVLSSLSSAGVNTVLGPYLTAYFGLTRPQGTGLLAVSIGAGVVGLGGGVGPLVRGVGEVGALQACLAGMVAFPLLLTACQSMPQVGLVCGMLSAPLFMLAPVISGIKSNLVAETEQGLVQGAIACVCNIATALSDVIFGFIYRHVTEGGTNPSRSSAFPLFFASGAFALASWLLALTLPRQLPPPALAEGSCKAAEPLLRAEA